MATPAQGTGRKLGGVFCLLLGVYLVLLAIFSLGASCLVVLISGGHHGGGPSGFDLCLALVLFANVVLCGLSAECLIPIGMGLITSDSQRRGALVRIGGYLTKERPGIFIASAVVIALLGAFVTRMLYEFPYLRPDWERQIEPIVFSPFHLVVVLPWEIAMVLFVYGAILARFNPKSDPRRS